MNRYLEFLPEDYCSNCNTAHSIELYNVLGKPIGYTELLNESNSDALTQKFSIASFFRCNKCGVTYPIEWRSGKWIPTPMKFFSNEDYLNLQMGKKRI